MEANKNQAVSTANVTPANGKHEPTVAELQARIKELEAKVATKQTISFKVTEKGGVSLYGLGRFAVTLYLSQWQALIPAIPALVQFMKANESKLSVKE